jgi:large subunit ribosomal protein L6
MSRLGKKPIIIPSDVKVNIENSQVNVEGPKGKLTYALSGRIKIELKDNRIMLSRSLDTKIDRSMHGLSYALISNMVKGVSQGYKKELEIVGVGFRAQTDGKNLTLQLGFSHLVNFPIPEGIKIETPKPTQILIHGIDKEKVGSVAATIRATFPTEPYKGKGIRYSGEYVKKKLGKAATSTK